MILSYIWDGSVSFEDAHVNAREQEKQVKLEALTCRYNLTVSDDQASMAGEAAVSIAGLNAEHLTVDRASVRLSAKGIDVVGCEQSMAPIADLAGGGRCTNASGYIEIRGQETDWEGSITGEFEKRMRLFGGKTQQAPWS